MFPVKQGWIFTFLALSSRASNINKLLAQTFFYRPNMKHNNDLFDFGKKVPARLVH